jgi:hypothetical protein
MTYPKPRYKWRPLGRGIAKPISEEEIANYTKLGAKRELVIAYLEAEEKRSEYWLNDIYQVLRRDLGDNWVHLNIRRRDGAAILRDWRHFQTIKNELIGEECEAVELYPAESRLSDESNKYHLFGNTNPAFRFPFGDVFGGKRNVSYESGTTPGTRQRPL